MTRIDTVTLTNAGLLEAFDFAKRAQDRAAAAFLAKFPPDATISWDRKGVQFGQVAMRGYADDGPRKPIRFERAADLLRRFAQNVPSEMTMSDLCDELCHANNQGGEGLS